MKHKISTSIVLVSLLMCQGAYAESLNNSDLDLLNWDHPAEISFNASAIEKKIVSTQADFEWSSKQLQQFQTSDPIKQFNPALRFKTDDQDVLRSKLMISNVPGAKFERKDALYEHGEEIMLTVMDSTELKSNKSYIFSTSWLRTSKSNSNVMLQTLQRYSQPNGALYNIDKTEDQISKIDVNDAPVSDKEYRDYHLSEKFDGPFYQYQDGEANKQVKSYALINSKEKLDAYKSERAKNLKFSNDGDSVQFAITFNKPVSPEGLKKLAEAYNLTISQIYAAGMKENNEEYTVSWYDTGMDAIYLLGPRFVTFTITELEGTAKAEDLKRISELSSVDVIDIEQTTGKSPTGVHWLNNRYAK
ncbi:hypothetical protein [Paenibacillus aceris]|uniref:Uncharacterized protein n=1 Tax=Paenibacillus aceris TaxID=869555 RepID=A0ABS4HUH5_9BACL|nr:hypothetical protein [Paenibacillus aceris]MBP1961896.1 hypothetical protein [Paenibacillus aceris]NHW34253.1 hypothetical protein [Paenibacillus aceris]